MDSGNERTRHWLTASLATVLAVALGAGLGWWLRGGATQAESLSPAAALAPATSVSREQIEALRSELLARLDELARLRATITPATPADDGQVIELGRRIDALDARIALLDTRATRKDDPTLWTPPKGPGSGSIDAIIERMQAWYGDEKRRPPGDDIESQLEKEHDLWTFDDVVRAYGAPRRWDRDEEGWDLHYGCFQVGNWELKQSATFYLRSGYVSTIQIGDCEP